MERRARLASLFNVTSAVGNTRFVQERYEYEGCVGVTTTTVFEDRLSAEAARVRRVSLGRVFGWIRVRIFVGTPAPAGHTAYSVAVCRSGHNRTARDEYYVAATTTQGSAGQCSERVSVSGCQSVKAALGTVILWTTTTVVVVAEAMRAVFCHTTYFTKPSLQPTEVQYHGDILSILRK